MAVGSGLGKRAGRGALEARGALEGHGALGLLERLARFCSGSAGQRGMWPDVGVVVAQDAKPQEVFPQGAVGLQSPDLGQGLCRMNNPHQGARRAIDSREPIAGCLNAG